MLILIDSSVVDDGDENTWDDETVVALDYLATARREGKHSVIANRETLKKIAQCSRLSQKTRDIYTKLYNRSPQNYKSYPSVVKRYIEIVKPCLEPQVVDSLGKKIIKVPPGFFNDSKLVQETILLCENSDDAILYETIAKVYLIWKKFNAQIVCDRRGGGGNTISSEYINIKQAKKCFCLCIVDSDKIAPDGKLGSTASGLFQSDKIAPDGKLGSTASGLPQSDKIAPDGKLGSTASGLPQSDSTDCIKTQTFILDCREIENLIPNSILSELLSGNLQRLEALKILESISVVEVRSFLDIKEGTRMKEIIDKKDSKADEFWQLKLALIPNISARIDNWCQTHWQCSKNTKKISNNSKKSSKNSKEECECEISLGFGKNTLSDTLKYLEEKNPHEIAKIVDRSKHSDWEKIGQVVMDWCIAESPIRA
jgi:hypothetical protein